MDSLESWHRERVLLLAFCIKSSQRIKIFLLSNNCGALMLSNAVKSSPLLNAFDEFVDGSGPYL